MGTPGQGDVWQASLDALPLSFKRKASHYYPDLPTLRIGTMNQGMGGLGTLNTRKKRYAMTRANMWSLMRKSDAVFSQEAKFVTESYLESYVGWKGFLNQGLKKEYVEGDDEKEKWKAGGVIWLRTSFLKNFEPQHIIIEEGYVHYVVLRPKAVVDTRYPVFTKACTLLNIYLHSNTIYDVQKVALLRKMTAHSFPTEFIYAAGDTNIREEGECSSRFISSEGVRTAYYKFLARHKLREIHQPYPTRLDGRAWSRIDRVFMATPGDIDMEEFMDMTVSLPKHPYEPGRGIEHPSDHYQVLLTPTPATLGEGARFVIPLWLVRKPAFASRVKERWRRRKGKGKGSGRRSGRKKRNPFERLKLFDEIMVSVAKIMMKENAGTVEGKVMALAVAISQLRKLKAREITVGEAWSRCGEISELKSSLRDKEPEDLQEVLQRFIRQKTEQRVQERATKVWRRTTSAYSEEVSESIPIQHAERTDYIRSQKRSLEPSKSHLPFLVEGEEYVTCPTRMAKLLKETWEPIWEGRQIPDSLMDGYLASYTKRIQGEIRPVELADVIRVIADPKKTCAGPNGIPFAAYAAVCATVAPVFLEVIRAMCQGRSPIKGYGDFNMSDLYFLPKDDSMLPDHTRPIAASNTCNRIVANVVRARIETPLLEMLCRTQTGFVRDRSIEENVRFYNDRLTRALGEGKSYNVLLLDFAKAYDSVSRKYVLKLLSRVGVPESYSCLIGGLFRRTYATPVMQGKHGVRLAMLDGLKQGCPLSPLLFILAIDPLLTHLGDVQGAEERCFADDLGVGFRDWQTLMPVTELIDYWSDAAGPQVSHRKTKVMSTDVKCPELCRVLPEGWEGVQYADRYKYLGVLISTDREFGVAEVFAMALRKFKGRVSDMMRKKRHFSQGARVEMANTYLIPIFSYLMRFYIMDDETLKQVRELLEEWCVDKSMSFEKLMAPPADAGLAQPLKDVRYVNLAIMLRGCTGREDSYGHPMHMGAHRSWAARCYEKWTGLSPWRKEQKVLLQKLILSCHEPILAMAKTMSDRKGRHKWPKKPTAKGLMRRVLQNTRTLPAKLAPVLRNHLFKVLHGTLPTNASWVPTKGKEREAPVGCDLCGDLEVKENLEHLMVDCKVTKGAIELIIDEAEEDDRKSLLFLKEATLENYELRTHKLGKSKLMLIVVMSRAVWRARWDCKDSRLNFRERQRQVVEQFQKASKWAKGGGGRRRDKGVEVHDFKEMMDALPLAHHAYTDGSAFKYTDHTGLVEMTGPSGCGAYVLLQDGQELFRSRHLGVGTNAMAEVQGMRDAAALFLENEPEDTQPLYIFTDNRAAIKAATGAKTPWWCAQEAIALRSAMKEIAESRRVICFWVPSHGGVRGNEVADRLARRGATGVSSDEKACPEDHFAISKEDLVVATALWRRDYTCPVALEGPVGVLLDGKGPRAKRKIGEVCWMEDGHGDQSEEGEAEDAPT